MGEPQPIEAMSAAEYLDWEPAQVEKYEFSHGEIFAMGGASRRHVTVSGNVFFELAQALAETPCRVYMADMKLEVEPDRAYFYPDVLVTCDPDDHRSDQFMRRPTLLVEVLSASTAAFDRGDKATIYRRIPSLKEFVLIDPDRQRIELYRRQEDGAWELRDIDPDQPLPLTSLGTEIPWPRIFRNAD